MKNPWVPNTIRVNLNLELDWATEELPEYLVKAIAVPGYERLEVEVEAVVEPAEPADKFQPRTPAGVDSIDATAFAVYYPGRLKVRLDDAAVSAIDEYIREEVWDRLEVEAFDAALSPTNAECED